MGVAAMNAVAAVLTLIAVLWAGMLVRGIVRRRRGDDADDMDDAD